VGKNTLPPSEIIEITRCGKQIHEHYNSPQDIEWAIDRDMPFPENVLICKAARKPFGVNVKESLFSEVKVQSSWCGKAYLKNASLLIREYSTNRRTLPVKNIFYNFYVDILLEKFTVRKVRSTNL
jgi:hypothetical protein